MALAALITWNYALSDNTGFLLQRSADSGLTWAVNFPQPNTSSYVDATIVTGSTYWYRVAATNLYGTGSWSNTGSVFTYLPPNTPLNLLLASGSVIATWDSSSIDSDHSPKDYYTFQKSTDGINFTELQVRLIETATDTNVTASILGNTYYYRVAAVNIAGSSSFTASNITFTAVMTPPSNLIVSSGSSILNWVGSSYQDYYAIQRSTDGLAYVDYATSVPTSYTDEDVTASLGGNTYWYKVAAVNSISTSSFSNTASITFTSGGPPLAPLSLTVTSGSAILNWVSQSNDQDSFSIHQSLDGITYINFVSVNPSLVTGSNLLTNGGFETGDFTGWSMTDVNDTTEVVSGEASFVHDGTYGVLVGAYNGNYGTMSQVASTTSGSTYNVSFWMSSADGGTAFRVYWEGNQIADLTSTIPTGWTLYTYPVTASADGSELKFYMLNELEFFGLDTISVSELTQGTILPSTYTDTGVSSSLSGNTYYYKVAGVNAYGTSSFSNTASITFTTELPPQAPALAVYLQVTSGSAILDWQKSGSAPVDYWNIYRSETGPSGSFVQYTQSLVTHSVDTNLTQSNTYWYQVQSFNQSSGT